VSEFKGNTLVSIREYWKNDADELKPGKKVSCHLPSTLELDVNLFL
jgi:hypothetical protein